MTTPYANSGTGSPYFINPGGLGQFQCSECFLGDGGTLTQAVFSVAKGSSATGQLFCKLYAASGTPGVNAVPSGPALEISSVDLSTVGTSFGNITFLFAGTTTLSSGVAYAIELSWGDENLTFDSVTVDAGGDVAGANAEQGSISFTSPDLNGTVTAGAVAPANTTTPGVYDDDLIASERFDADTYAQARFDADTGDNASSSTVYSYTSSGGIVFAGTAARAKVKAYAPSGGIVFSGSAARAKVKAYAPAGGIVFAGTATLAKAKAYAPSGGIVFAGTAARAKVKAYAPAGGIVFSGGAAFSKIKAYASSGGIVFGGVASSSYVPAGVVYSYAGSGGIVFAGGAAFSKIKAYASSGGIVFGGAAVLAKGKAWSGSGGIVFAGAALASYAPVGGGSVYSYAGSGGLAIGGQATSSYVAAAPAADLPGGGGRMRPEWSRTEAWPPKWLPVEPQIFEHVGAGGLAIGGEAATSFEPVPAKVYEALVGRLNSKQLGGAAATEFVDSLADAREADAHDLVLIAELAR